MEKMMQKMMERVLPVPGSGQETVDGAYHNIPYPYWGAGMVETSPGI
jgi:hypothetical protein